MKRLMMVLLLLMSTAATAMPWDEPPPRRNDPFPTEYAHMLLPLPYRMPGIGEGYFLMGYLSNLYETTGDVAVVLAKGDAEGVIGQLDELPLIEDRLHLQLFDMRISKASISDYAERGMGAGADFNVLELDAVSQQSAELTLSGWQRRLALTARYARSSNEVSAIRDANGDILTRYQPPSETRGVQRSLRAMLDLTDDYQDPRQGWRLHLDFADHPAEAADNPDFYTLDWNLLYFLPVNDVDTIAFNYYRSDAHLRSQGELDPAVVAASLGGSCAPLDTVCIDAAAQRVANIIAANRYGTATALGGTDRLRSYGDGRFTGAHMEFVGVEFRSNFVQGATPFDFFIWKDISTSIQLALFAESGTVAETTDALWDEHRESVGIGARLVSASGSVYRADWAYGDEGAEFSVFFFYPWR